LLDGAAEVLRWPVLHGVAQPWNDAGIGGSLTQWGRAASDTSVRGTARKLPLISEAVGCSQAGDPENKVTERGETNNAKPTTPPWLA